MNACFFFTIVEARSLENLFCHVFILKFNSVKKLINIFGRVVQSDLSFKRVAMQKCHLMQKFPLVQSDTL